MRPRPEILLPVLAATALAAAGGCNLIGVVAQKTAGQIPVDAKYAPDPTVPIVVLVENYRGDGSGDDADRVARLIGARLAEQKVAPIVGPEKVRDLRERNPTAYRAMGVAQVGKAVGAGGVLYVDLVSVGVGVQMGSDVAKGVAQANVRFIDATTGLVAYPAELTDGTPVGHETTMRRLGNGVTIDSMRAELLIGLSDRIARLFFRYKPDDITAPDDDPGLGVR